MPGGPKQQPVSCSTLSLLPTRRVQLCRCAGAPEPTGLGTQGTLTPPEPVRGPRLLEQWGILDRARASRGWVGPGRAQGRHRGASGCAREGPHPDIGQDFPAPLGLSTVPESANAPVIVSNVDAQSLAHHAIKNQPLSFNLDPFNRGLEGRADSPLTPLSPLLVRACARVESGTQDAVRQGREEGPCLGERMLLRERCGWVGRAFGFGVGPPGPDRAELRRLPPRFAPRRPGRAPCTGALPPGRPTCRPRCAGWGCTMAGPCRRRGFAIRGATLRHPSKSGYPRPTTCRPP